MISSVDYHWLMRQAIGIACQAKVIGEPPFAALVAHIESGEILASSTDMVNTYNNKAAHAEVLAISKLCESEYSGDFAKLALITTVEPCAMCFINAWINKFAKIVYGASMLQVHEATNGLQVEFPITAIEMSRFQKTALSQDSHEIEVIGGIEADKCLSLFDNYIFPE